MSNFVQFSPPAIFNHSAMTCPPIGAARPEPEPPDSTSTATAIVGVTPSWAGAKPMNHE